MTVTEAVLTRRSIRAFLPKPVPEAILREVVEKASWAPSNSNIQPWHVKVVQGSKAEGLKALTRARAIFPPEFDQPGYGIYPDPLADPYAARRFQCGENQYGMRGVARDDPEGRLRYVYNNHQFFGAPAALFLFIDKNMGPSQWADCGCYLQTVMLLLQEAGVDSCAQISWQVFNKTVREFFGAPESWLLYCGVSIGYRDPADPINTINPGRAPVLDFAEFLID